MWQRSFQSQPQPWDGLTNGDGCHAMDGRGISVSMQHPWMSGTPLYAPDNWAPTYDYPLICYLHDDDRSEQELWRWFPAISDQNYLGVGIRAPYPTQNSIPGQYRWRGQRPDATAAVLNETIQMVQSGWNVHPDRIVLFGEGNGAVAALQQFTLNQVCSDEESIRFSGVICRDLPSWWARAIPPVVEFGTGRILLLDPVLEIDEDGEVPAAIDGFNEAGISVTLAGKSDTSPAGLINQWMMAGVSTAVF